MAMSAEEKLKIVIEAQNKAQAAFDEAKDQIEKTEQKVKSLTDRMDAAGKKAQAVGGKMTKYMTLPILGLGAVAFKAGAELQDSMGAVDQIFKKSSGIVKDWADKLPTYYGIAKTEALQYSSTMGSMMKNIGGLTEKEAAKQSGKLIELAGDLSATFGGSTQDAVRALTGALKGNNTMLDNYGISALQAEVKAEAMRKGLMKADVDMVKVEAATIKVNEARKKANETIKKYGKGSDEARKANNELALAQQGVETAMAGSTSEMDAATKQAATLSLVMDQTKDIQGQAAREAAGGSGQLKAMQTEMKNLSAEVGTKLLPVGIKLLGWASGLATAFGKLSPKTQTVILVVLGLVAALGPLVYIVGTVMRSFKAMKTAVNGAKDAYAKFGPKATSALSKVKSGASQAASATKSMAMATKDFIKYQYKSIKMSAQYKAHLIKENILKAAAKVKTVALTVAEKARTVATKIGTAIQAAFNAVMAMNPIFLVVIAVVALIAVMVLLYKKNKTVRDFIDKSWRAISSVFMSVFNVVKSVISAVFGWIKNNWQLIAGIVLGPLALILVAFFKYKEQFMAVFKAIWTVIKWVWDGIVAVISWAWDTIIKPIWDLLVAYVTNILIPGWKLLWSAIQVVWNAIVTVIKWAWENVIKPVWDLIRAYITNVLVPIWTKVWEAVQAAWDFMKPIFEAIWAYITDTLVPIFQKIWDKVSDVFTKVWNAISGWVTNVKEGFDKVKGWITTLIEKFVGIKDKISEAFTTVGDAIKAPFKTAFNWIAKGWNKTLGKLSFTIPSWVPEIGGKKFDMPDMPTLYKGVRNFGGGLAKVGDINGRGGEIINMPAGSDVYNNKESKRIMRAMAEGQFTPDGRGGGTANTFTGNIYLMNAEAVQEFFAQLDRQGELSAMGVPA